MACYHSCVAAADRVRMSYEQYLAAEAVAEVKHEYLRGEVWAMSGGTPEHGRLAISFATLLGQALAGRPCAIFNSDVRIRIEATDRSTYPDLSVVCGKKLAAKNDKDALTNPVVLIEVLSDSTEASDRGEKFSHYRQLESLKEYVLVSQKEPRIEVFRRDGAHWTLYEASAGERIQLASLDVTLDVDAIYRDPLA